MNGCKTKKVGFNKKVSFNKKIIVQEEIVEVVIIKIDCKKIFQKKEKVTLLFPLSFFECLYFYNNSFRSRVK